MKKFLAAMCVCLLLILAGCSSSSLDDPQLGPTDKYDVDWSQCKQDTVAAFAGQEEYSFVREASVMVDHIDRSVIITAIIEDDTDPEDVLNYADAMIREFNRQAQLQDPSIPSDEGNYYGGVYDDCPIRVGMTTENKMEQFSQWYIKDVIDAGGMGPVKLLQTEKAEG